jgi:hypothetical protein
MGCNCKTNNVADLAFNTKSDGKIKRRWYTYVFEYIVKIFAFLITIVVGLPILNGYVIYLVFKLLVLNQNLNANDLVSSLVSLTKKFTPKDDDDDDDDDDDEDDDDDYELTDVDEIEELTIFEKNK